MAHRIVSKVKRPLYMERLHVMGNVYASWLIHTHTYKGNKTDQQQRLPLHVTKASPARGEVMLG